MRKISALVLAGLLIGAVAASHAKLPAAPAKSDAEKAAETQKAAAAKAKDAELLNKAQDKAAANYRKNSGEQSSGASVDTRKKAAAEPKPVKGSNARGADHSAGTSPQHEPSRKEEATAMPLPGQANDHSSTARDPKQSSRR